jgi:hypothetical protein
VDVNNNNNNGGNPELVPPQSWIAQLETIRNLGAHGKIRVNLEAEDVSDIVNQVPISSTAEAPGNVPKARRFQVTFDAGLLLDAVGLPGGKLDAFFTWRDTRIRDPLFGTPRQWNGNRYYWNVDFRHDVPNTPWTWGLFAERQSRNYYYRLDYEEQFWGSQPFGVIFIEHKDVAGLKVRFALQNALNNREQNLGINYVNRRDGPIDYMRHQTITYHPMFQFVVSGTF